MAITRPTHAPLRFKFKGKLVFKLRADRPTMLTHKELEEGKFRPGCVKCNEPIHDHMLIKHPGERAMYHFGKNGANSYYIITQGQEYIHVSPSCIEVNDGVELIWNQELGITRWESRYEIEADLDDLGEKWKHGKE